MYESIDISELRKLYSLYSDNIQALADVIQVLRIRKENETISRTKQLKKMADILSILLSEKKSELTRDIQKMKRIQQLILLIDKENSDLEIYVKMFQESLLYEKYGVSSFDIAESIVQLKSTFKSVRKDYCETSPDKFIYSNYEYGICIDSYIAEKDMTIIIPEMINGRPVLKIGDRAFRKCGYLRNVRLPETLRIIGKGAFWFEKPHNLYRINIPYTVDTIMNYAFLNNSPEIIYCNSSSYGMKWAKEHGLYVSNYEDLDIK